MRGPSPHCRWTNWGWRGKAIVLAGFWLEPDPDPDPDPNLLASPPHRSGKQAGKKMATWVSFSELLTRNSWISKAVCWEVFVPYWQACTLPSCSSLWLFFWPKIPQTGKTGQGSAPDSQTCPASCWGILVGSHKEASQHPALPQLPRRLHAQDTGCILKS